MKKIILLFSALFFIAVSCSNKQKPANPLLKEYFFDYTNLFSPDTIDFVNLNDTSEKAYWVLQTKLEGVDTLLLSTLLNTKKQLSEEMTLKINENDCKIVQYTLYNDSLLSAQCQIIDSTFFDWYQDFGDTISWKVQFQEFSKKGIVQILRSRALVKLDTLNNEAIFWDSNKMFLIESRLGYNFFIESHYKKGQGLTEYKITNPKGIIKDFKRIN